MTEFAQPQEALEVRTLLTGLGFGESPRWYEGAFGSATGQAGGRCR